MSDEKQKLRELAAEIIESGEQYGFMAYCIKEMMKERGVSEMDVTVTYNYETEKFAWEFNDVE